MELPKILTAQNIADYLQIGRKRVYELMQLSPNHGGIPTFNVGKSRRVELLDFETWLSQRKR
ncbi:MAG TPA: helix-turn-helix domain-containing protein [Candidatus Paenibacillus intestinavium]|nr:helix-turn-helix domain-containing protein [Candidatus Paenibacillus intestinavium]